MLFFLIFVATNESMSCKSVTKKGSPGGFLLLPDESACFMLPPLAVGSSLPGCFFPGLHFPAEGNT
jgi:hypothetical protein